MIIIKYNYQSRFCCCSDRSFFPSQLSQHIIVYQIVSVINYLKMSSSSGGDSCVGKSPAPNKIKPSLSTNRTPDSNNTLATSKKNLRKSKSNLRMSFNFYWENVSLIQQ